LRFLGGNDLTRDLRPIGIAARVITDQPRVGAIFADDADLGLLGKCVFEPVGEPVRVRITHNHDLGRSILARSGGGRPRKNLRPLPLPLPFSLPPGAGAFPSARPPTPPPTPPTPRKFSVLPPPPPPPPPPF